MSSGTSVQAPPASPVAPTRGRPRRPGDRRPAPAGRAHPRGCRRGAAGPAPGGPRQPHRVAGVRPLGGVDAVDLPALRGRRRPARRGHRRQPRAGGPPVRRALCRRPGPTAVCRPSSSSAPGCSSRSPRCAWTAIRLAPRSAPIAAELARSDEVLRSHLAPLFAPELGSLPPLGVEVTEALDALSSWETWERLRTAQRLDARIAAGIVSATGAGRTRRRRSGLAERPRGVDHRPRCRRPGRPVASMRRRGAHRARPSGGTRQGRAARLIGSPTARPWSTHAVPTIRSIHASAGRMVLVDRCAHAAKVNLCPPGSLQGNPRDAGGTGRDWPRRTALAHRRARRRRAAGSGRFPGRGR